jgi:hypothetical protein
MHYNYGREADWIVFRHSSRMIPVTHIDVIDVIITYVTSHFFQLLWLSDGECVDDQRWSSILHVSYIMDIA